MAHNHDILLAHNELAERIRHHARLNARTFFMLFCLAAVKAELAVVADDRLVAAAAKRHVERHARIFVVLCDRFAPCAYPNTDRGGRFVANADLAHTVQKLKLLLDEPVEVLMFKQENIAVALQFF